MHWCSIQYTDSPFNRHFGKHSHLGSVIPLSGCVLVQICRLFVVCNIMESAGCKPRLSLALCSSWHTRLWERRIKSGRKSCKASCKGKHTRTWILNRALNMYCFCYLVFTYTSTTVQINHIISTIRQFEIRGLNWKDNFFGN